MLNPENTITANRSDTDVLLDTLNLKGKRVVDVGCGEGALTHQMAVLGAEVLGIDPDQESIATARSANSNAICIFQEGVAEEIPLDDNSVDIVVFFNSLHHVKPEFMDAALIEAWRVLKPSGELYLSEPMAAGSNFETTRLFSDESAVRNAAYDAIKRLVSGQRFLQIEEKINVRPRVVENFEAFCRGISEGNPKRAALLEKKRDEIRALFDQHGHKVADGYEFIRLTRVNLLRKV